MKVDINAYARLTKLSKNKNDVRTEAMVGFAKVPRFGERLVIVGKGLEHPDRVRLIVTSLVQKVTNLSPTEFILQTENSTYRLQRLELSEEANALWEFVQQANPACSPGDEEQHDPRRGPKGPLQKICKSKGEARNV